MKRWEKIKKDFEQDCKACYGNQFIVEGAACDDDWRHYRDCIFKWIAKKQIKACVALKQARKIYREIAKSTLDVYNPIKFMKNCYEMAIREGININDIDLSKREVKAINKILKSEERIKKIIKGIKERGE